MRPFRALLTAAGQATLAEAELLAADRDGGAYGVDAIATGATPELAAAAWEQATLRRRALASGKFARAAAMYFTRDALEQATGEAIAAHRARRYAPFGPVADLACGIGGDALALAEVHAVLAIDRDPLRLAILRENARAYGYAERISPIRADLTALLAAARRGTLLRSGSPHRRWAARLHRRCLSAAAHVVLLACRSSPHSASKFRRGSSARNGPTPDEAEIEFISEGGTLKEAVLWFGPLRGVARRATLLPAGATLVGEGEIGARSPPDRPVRSSTSRTRRSSGQDWSRIWPVNSARPSSIPTSPI